MLRLIAAILLFLSSLLCIIPAPIYWLWYVAILVSELPWIFIIACLLLLVFIFRKRKFRVPAAAFCMVALCLFLSPIIRAYQVAAHLRQDITQAFSSLQSVGKQGYHFSCRRRRKTLSMDEDADRHFLLRRQRIRPWNFRQRMMIC